MRCPPYLCVAKGRSHARSASAMKWQNRIAQGFSPGYWPKTNRPESGDRPERCRPAERDKLQHKPRHLVFRVFATIHSGAPSGRISYLALPRAKDLGYFVLPFHGGCVSRMRSPLGPFRHAQIGRTPQALLDPGFWLLTPLPPPALFLQAIFARTSRTKGNKQNECSK